MKIFFSTSSRCRGATELRAGQRRPKLSASALHHLNIISPVWCSAHVLEREDWTASENPELGQSGGAGGGGGGSLSICIQRREADSWRTNDTELRSEELEDVGWNAAEERLRHCVGHMQGTRWPTDPPPTSLLHVDHMSTKHLRTVQSHHISCLLVHLNVDKKWLDFNSLGLVLKILQFPTASLHFSNLTCLCVHNNSS